VPELLEVETYRRAASAVVGRRVRAVELIDPNFWRSDHDPRMLQGALVTEVRRVGKLMLVDTDVAVLGVRFGMTGRLIVDGGAPIAQLEYSSSRDLPSWHRFGLSFVGGGALVVSDPRRLGWVEIDPDESRLGPDAAGVGLAALRDALGASAAPLKAKLMDQQRLAGLGNLLTDEILFRSGLDPRRPAGELTPAEMRRLHRHLVATIVELGQRGGSHTGDLQVHRTPGGRCPRDDHPLERSTIGARTTWWCPDHQR
jgi:formamidopyrimidine-DNA glycosylase